MLSLLRMNEDKIPCRKYCISTSKRNFEGRQGPNARHLTSLTGGSSAITRRVLMRGELYIIAMKAINKYTVPLFR
jgi:3-isopropylmalate/(R)-2-methylmalate dehydratase large subunit